MFAKISKRVAASIGVAQDDVRLVVLSNNASAIDWLLENMEELQYASEEEVPKKIGVDVRIDGRRYAYVPNKEIVFTWI